MSSLLPDLVKIQVLSSGTGPFQLGAAATGFRGIEALIDGGNYSYSVQSGAQYEVGTCVWNAGSGLLIRTPLLSSNGNAAVAFGANVEVKFVVLGQDLAPEGAAKLNTDGSNAASDLLENIKSLLFVATGSGGIGASLNTRFRYDVHLGSFGYPVDSGSDVTPALNAAMASGRDVYIPNVPGGLNMLTQPAYPTTRYSLYGDESRSQLNKKYVGGAAFEIRGSNQSIRNLVVDFQTLAIADAGFLIDMRTDLYGIELTETHNLISQGAGGLLRDRPSASNVSTIWRASQIYGRLHRGVGCSIQRQFAFLEWDDLVADFVLSELFDKSAMIVWDINGNQGGYAQKLETSNIPRIEDYGMIGMRFTGVNALRVEQGLQDGVTGDAFLINGDCANIKLINTAASICSGSAIKIRDNGGANSNTNIQITNFNGVGRRGVVGGYSPANINGLDIDGVGQLKLTGRFQDFTGSGMKARRLSELSATGVDFRANTRYGIETTDNLSGSLVGGSTIANGLGDYLNGGAGSAAQFFHGQRIWGNGGGIYDFVGVA